MHRIDTNGWNEVLEAPLGHLGFKRNDSSSYFSCYSRRDQKSPEADQGDYVCVTVDERLHTLKFQAKSGTRLTVAFYKHVITSERAESATGIGLLDSIPDEQCALDMFFDAIKDYYKEAVLSHE